MAQSDSTQGSEPCSFRFESWYVEFWYLLSMCQVYNGHSMTHRSEIRALLESPERPDALFVANDVMAIEIMQLAEMLRLSVPDDISIAGLENMHRSTLSTPQLTTAGYDKRLLAEECVKLLFEHIDNRNVGVTARKVPMELIVRGSTAEKRQ